MKNYIKKGVSGLLAFLMCFTGLLSAGVTPAFAASETCTTYSVGFPRDGDANQVYSNEVWGHPALTHMNGWHSNDVDLTTLHCMNGYDGQICYCIEPAVEREMGETMSGFGEDFWDNYPSNLNNTIQPDDIKILLGRIMQYLMPGTYTVTEQGYDRYEPQETRRVTVVSGQTATVSFNNVLKRGELRVTKTSEDGMNEGVTFHLYGTSLSGIPVDEYAVTDASGTAVFEDVLIGTGYTLEEEKLFDTCDKCNGTGYLQEVLSWQVDGLNIYDIQQMTVDELISSNLNISTKANKMLELLSKLGLGYLKLNQKVKTLSGGENQRIKLAEALNDNKFNMIGLDEPAKGLGRRETARLLGLIYKQVSKNKKTFIIAEHDTMFLNYCSYFAEFTRKGQVTTIAFQGSREQLFNDNKNDIRNWLTADIKEL